MITTKDVRVKEARTEKLTSLTTGNTKPQEFAIKGNAKPRDKRIITTRDVGTPRRKARPGDEEKKFAARARRARIKAEKKKAKAKAGK